MKTILYSKDKQTASNCKADQKIYTQQIQLQQIIDYEMYFEKVQVINLWIVKQNIQSSRVLKQICKILFKKSINNVTYYNLTNNELIPISIHNFHIFEFDKVSNESYINSQNDKIVEQHRLEQNNFSVFVTVLAEKSKKEVQNQIKLHQNCQNHNYLLLFAFNEKDIELLDEFLNPDILAKESAKLSQQYLYIKQQIQEVKAQFKTKLRGLQIIIGQNIQMEKLLADIKDDNAEFKRLKEVFENIRNIDSILQEQQRKLAQATKKVKQKQIFKYTLQHQHAKTFNRKKQEIAQKKKEIAQLENNISFLTKSETNTDFQQPISVGAQKIIEQHIKLYKKTINNSKDFIIRGKPSSIKVSKSPSTLAAIYGKQEKRKQYCYQKCNKKYQKKIQQQNDAEGFEQLAVTLYKMYTKNNMLIEEVENFRNKNKNKKSCINFKRDEQFPLIKQLLTKYEFSCLASTF